jgi:hypothetical protein
MHSFCAAVPKIMVQTKKDLPVWHIGTTADVARTRAELGRPGCFQAWAMDELHDAQDLASFFSKLGMAGRLGKTISSAHGSHVFIVRERGPHCKTCERRSHCGRA